MAKTTKKTIGNFTNGERFPLDANTLQTLQDNQELIEVLGNIAGDKIILTGCEVENGNRSEGYVFLRTNDYPQGEILHFGGGPGDSVYISKTAINIEANDETFTNAYTERSLIAGIGDENYKWDEFSKVQTNAELKAECERLQKEIDLITPPPLGVVQMWAGSIEKIPEDYCLCDGRKMKKDAYADLYNTIGTVFGEEGNEFCLPDLRGKFIVGYHKDDDDYNAVGKKGGEKTHRLTQDEMPSHSHVVSDYHHYKKGGHDDWNHPCLASTAEWDYGGISTQATGGNQGHENRPPYFVLAYIMRVK